jgi:hypothetical protein
LKQADKIFKKKYTGAKCQTRSTLPMGIHGLSYFIKSFPSLAETKKWPLQSVVVLDPRDHFIIDGNAFVYHIAFEHRTNWTHGGQYATIAQVISKTISALRKAGIRLTFLFDGALPQDKRDTRIKRHKSYIERCVSTFWNLKQINTSNKNAEERQNGIQYFGDLFLIPPLTLEVTVQTLRELDVQVIICDAEADGEVVAMANREGAYVVSQDSDMHVYPNIGKGYIPLELLRVPIDDEEKQQIIAGVFHPETFAKMLNLDVSLLPLFGTLLGNDYVDAELVRFPIGQWCSLEGIQIAKNNQSGWPKIVAEFVRRCNQEQGNTIKNVVDKLKPIIAKSNMRSREEKASGFEDRMIDSIYRYDAQSALLINLNIEKVLATENGSQTTKNNNDTFCKQSNHYRNGFSRQIMDVIASSTFWTSIFIEDIERESSWDVSRSLRQGVYGTINEILGLQEEIEMEDQEQQGPGDKEQVDKPVSRLIVDEYGREKQHLGVLQVTGGVIHVQRSSNVNNFYRFHYSNQSHVASFDPLLHPFILCSRYMIYHCSKSIENGRLLNYEVIAMIVAVLRSLAPTLGYTGQSVPLPITGTPALKKRSIHLSAQFQSIVYSSYLFSQVLDIEEYLQLPHVLASMYDGVYFHYYIEAARGGASIGAMLQGVSPEFQSLFCSVYRTIMTDLNNDVQDVFDYDIVLTMDCDKWSISDNKPKRLNSLKSASSKRPEKKKKSSPSNGAKNNRSANAFNVLSFGCNFDE